MNEEKITAIKTGFGGLIYGLTLNEWVAISTIVFFTLQSGLLLPKYWRLIKGKDKS